MKAKRWYAVLVSLVLLTGTVTYSQTTNRWTNDVTGTWWWHTPENWSAGAPASNQRVLITNANTKTVRIAGVGPGTCSTVSNLIISAPVGTTNTLQLDDFEAPGVFVIRDSFTLSAGGPTTPVPRTSGTNTQESASRRFGSAGKSERRRVSLGARPSKGRNAALVGF